MNFADIKRVDVANGPGVRVSLFVSGCEHRCPGCFNPEAWDFGYGSPFGEEQRREILTLLDKSYIKGLSLLGGEPFHPSNQGVVLELVTRVKALFRRVDAFSGQEEAKDEYEFGDISLSPKRRAARLKGAEFSLTPLEFDFLCHMMAHSEHAASRDDLLKALWKVDSREVDTRAVDDMVKRLRKKLKEQGSCVRVETVWGYGFRLIDGGEE